MAKLTGAKKKAFLERMAKGRRKAARATKPRAKAKTAAKRNPKKTTRKKLTGKAKAEFLKRMARGRRKAAKGQRKPAAGTAAKRKNAGFGSARRSKKRTSSFGAKRAATEEGKLYRAKAKRTKATRRRGNSDESIGAAERMFEQFHQKAPERIIDYEGGFKYRENQAEMGELKKLCFVLDSANRKFPLTNFRGTVATCTPDGSNIFFISGDQSIDLEALGIATDKDLIELGPCNYIEYKTVKGFHDFEPIIYQHEFGEDDGILPVLSYDRLNHQLFLMGGNYRVRREGIVN